MSHTVQSVHLRRELLCHELERVHRLLGSTQDCHTGDRTQPKNPLFLMSSATPVGTIGSQVSSPSAIRLRTSRLKIER